MDRKDNPELKRLILDHLASMYKIKEIREPNHLSSYVYCLTKGFLDQKQTSEPTDEEVMLFALGYGLQDVLTPKEAKAIVHERHGVIYRPDMTMSRNEVERLQELKTTRKSAKYHYTDDALPETWIAYMQGGCYITEKTEYDLIILYMMGNYAPPFPQIYAETIGFSQDEIDQNWERIMANKAVLDIALASNEPPEPFKYCYEWECKYCRYSLICEALVQTASIRRIT